AAARDGEAIAWLSPDGLIVGNPRAEEEAQWLRQQVELAAGGRMVEFGQIAQRLLNGTLQRWRDAGRLSCVHLVGGDVGMLFTHEPTLARCHGCWVEYAEAHLEDPGERECDLCGGPLGNEVGWVGGPYGGMIVSAVVCQRCHDRIGREA